MNCNVFFILNLLLMIYDEEGKEVGCFPADVARLLKEERTHLGCGPWQGQEEEEGRSPSW